MGKPEILDKDVSAKSLESELTSVQTHIKEEIKDLSTEMRDKLAAKYEQRVKAIKEKYKDKTEAPIQGSKEKFAKLMAQIKEEHADKNEDEDTKTDDDKSEKKLSEKEIDGALATFEKDMSPVEAAAQTPAPAEVVKKITLDPIEYKPTDAEEKAIAEYKPKTNMASDIGYAIKEWIANFVSGFLPEWAAQLRGYPNANMEKKIEASFAGLTGDSGRSIIDKSPLSSILTLEHINKRALKDILQNNPSLDFSKTENMEAAFQGKHADKPELIKYHRIFEGIRLMTTEAGAAGGIGYDPKQRFAHLLTYSRDDQFDETIQAKYEEAKNDNEVLPIDNPPALAQTPEELQKQDQERKLAEIEKATTVDKKVQEAEGTQPKNDETIKVAKEEREVHNMSAAKKIQETFKRATSDLEKINNKLQVSGISETEKTQLEEHKKHIEASIKLIETELATLIIDIKKEPVEIVANFGALETTKIQHKIEDSYREVQEKTKQSLTPILGEQDQRSKEDQAIEAEINTTYSKIQELRNIVGVDGNKSLSKETIISNREKLNEIETLLAKIDNDSQGKAAVREKYEKVKSLYESVRQKYKFANVGSVKTDYDEGTVDYSINSPDAMKNVDFKRLIAISPDQEVAYFYVENLEGKSGYLRLILSPNDQYYGDTSAAFYQSEKTFTDEASAMKEIENDFFEYNFRTLEVNGTGWTYDDNLDWKKQTNWQAKIQALGLILDK